MNCDLLAAERCSFCNVVFSSGRIQRAWIGSRKANAIWYAPCTWRRLPFVLAGRETTTVWSGGGWMDRVEERMAYVEGRIEEQSLSMTELREAVVRLEARMDRRFEAVDRRFDAVDRRFDRLEDRMSRFFMWQVGIQIATLTAVGVALLR
jgi:hypothetical protein